jgi:hypothetical protein
MERVKACLAILDDAGGDNELLDSALMLAVNLFGAYLRWPTAADRDETVEQFFRRVRHALAAADRLGRDKLH